MNKCFPVWNILHRKNLIMIMTITLQMITRCRPSRKHDSDIIDINCNYFLKTRQEYHAMNPQSVAVLQGVLLMNSVLFETPKDSQ